VTAGSARLLIVVAVVAILAAAAVAWREIASAAANALLHPSRHRTTREPPRGCTNETFAGDGVALAGWRCRPDGPPRGAVVYLHGIADNRASAAGWLERLRERGFEAMAYDSRAHGDSTGDACTYGYFERRDLARVLDIVSTRPIVVVGTSLGAAVALQTAAIDRRIAAVVAAETFSDLRTIATERAPWWMPSSLIRPAFDDAERMAGFEVNAVSPVASAPHITAPTLLLHGAADVDTRPEHSRRVFDALVAPKKLVIVPGAGHNHALSPDTWPEVERWIEAAR
jgi:pimeloyl-ACP methyl ester carboxylesterase